MDDEHQNFTNEQISIQREIIQRMKGIEDPSSRLEFLYFIKPEFEELNSLVEDFNSSNNLAIETCLNSIRAKLLK